MFEFRMSYMEPGYHRPGDLPFSFPPHGVDSRIDANLIDIEGRNGTGKTTLLNCMALAMGYLDQEKELKTKPALRQKLQDMDKNKTLEYYFRICCDEPYPVELKIERVKGQKPRWWINSKRVDPDAVHRRFDLVFLTEDDPQKVVSASLGKLATYFSTLLKGLLSLTDSLNKHEMEISEYREFREKEEGMLKEIKKLERNAKDNRAKLGELQDRLEKVELKNQTVWKLELLSNEKEITSEYNSIRKKYEGLKDKKGTSIIRKLIKERYGLKLANNEQKKIDFRVTQTCKSLAVYGILIDSGKLLNGDHSELNSLNQKIQPQREQDNVKVRMIDGMIELFQNFLGKDIVPLIDKPVREVLNELFKIKLKSPSNRIYGLATALNNAIDDRKEIVVDIDKIQEKIRQLTQKEKDLEDIGDIRKSYVEAEKEYADLQTAQMEGRTELLSSWKQLHSIKGDPDELKDQIQKLQVQVQTEETLISKYGENLTLLRENATGKPRFEKKEKKLQDLNEKIILMRERVYNWTKILQHPESFRKDFKPTGEGQGFGLREYEKFEKAVGEYLGKQFEPVAFDYKLHDIKFFNIEKSTFTTSDDRQIPIAKLSQGQSKITTLTGSFKKMDSNKKKIVLVDEIADLDPENLRKVKATLQKKFTEGSLLLAILARPPRESSSKIIDINGWG